jgi:NarL family two-component system response regulator LiaR
MSASNPIRLMLVDDHRVVRRGLQSFLESFPDIQIIAEAGSGEEAIKLVGERLPDVAVMDIMMPGGIDGIETTRQVRSISPHTQVVVLTAHTGDERVIAALRAGAIGYVRKDADPEILLAGVRAAASGQSVLDPSVAGSVLNDLVRETGIESTLTEREIEVLRLLTHGSTNREIAEKLVVGEETVKTHVGNILSKLHLAHRTQAVIYALKQGLVSLDDIDLG